MSDPLVSAVITTYERPNLVQKAIKSALDQTYENLEVIVVDDGSRDRTPEVLEQYEESIRIIRQENQGRAVARNSGARHAKGELIAFLDDDDLWLPNKIETQVAAFREWDDQSLCHTWTEVIGPEGSPSGREDEERQSLHERAVERGYNYAEMTRLCVLFTSSILLPLSEFKAVDGFDPDMEPLEDWDLYLRLAARGEIKTIPEKLVRYRLHNGNTSSAAFARARIRVAEKHLHLRAEQGDWPQDSSIKANLERQKALGHRILGEQEAFRRHAWQALLASPLDGLFHRSTWQLFFDVVVQSWWPQRWKDHREGV